MDDVLKLGTRQGLPEDLRFLLHKHPRKGWKAQSALAGTAAFWLANHDVFRAGTYKIYEDLLSLCESGETNYDSGPALRRHIGSLIGGLEGHHNVEDHHYFPMFQSAEPRLARGFEILDGDHRLIHDALGELAATTHKSLERLGRTEGVMTSDQRFALDELVTVVKHTAPLLRQHLGDEEEIVIPLLLERARSDPDFG
ncbi:hemerythrin domain-containing protein [Leisingera sp.]|uniref:hemerythrin domain-containing protein n=1 Tax=Leisingera sp. TaxID=1879318 RepID=UPI002B272E24|nr:hemerythrin domain-containing protein [Leisingera sp.]